jgi:hypothetical protein
MSIRRRRLRLRYTFFIQKLCALCEILVAFVVKKLLLF